VGAFDEAREHVRRAIVIRRELGMVVATLAHEGNFLGLVETLAGDYDEAERVMLHSFNGLTEAGEHGYASTVAGHLANLYVIIGRYAEAERYATLAEEMSSPDDIDARARSLRSSARVAASRGDAERALDLARQAAAMVDVTDYLDLRGETYVDMAECRLSAGDDAGARGALEAAQAMFLSKGVSVEVARVAHRLQELG
jgi:tetratricopeptide (TPR) repeat protein